MDTAFSRIGTVAVILSVIAGVMFALYIVFVRIPHMYANDINQLITTVKTSAQQVHKQEIAAIPEGDFSLPNGVTEPLHSVRFDITSNQYSIDYMDAQNKMHTVIMDNTSVTFKSTTGTRHVAFHNKRAIVYIHQGDKITQYTEQTDSSTYIGGDSGFMPFFIPIPIR